MKLKCPKSGISYSVNIGYGHGKVPHPIFGLPTKALIMQNLDVFIMGKLSKTEVHLLGCALLNKLPIIWERPLQESVCIPFWKSHIEQLATIVMQHDPTKTAFLPKFKISAITEDLSNLSIYLHSVDSAILEYNNGNVKADYFRDRTEETILRLLRTALAKAEKTKMLPTLMADWASDVGRFPDTRILVSEGLHSTLREHWHYIIKKVFSVSSPVEILSETISLGDVDELIEHCEQNIDVGSIHSLALFRKLRIVKEVLAEFRSPAKLTNIQIAETNKNLVHALIDDASNFVQATETNKVYKDGEPMRSNYPTLTAFTRAKLAWARKQIASDTTETTDIKGNENG